MKIKMIEFSNPVKPNPGLGLGWYLRGQIALQAPVLNGAELYGYVKDFDQTLASWQTNILKSNHFHEQYLDSHNQLLE